MSWWKRLFSRKSLGDHDERSSNTNGPKATLLDADSPENPFGVPLVNLMENLQLTSTSENLEAATTVASWRPGDHERLTIEKSGPGVSCDLRYPAANILPDGMLFLPQAMEDKWVIALRDNSVVFARSWTGATVITADAKLENDALCLTQLYTTDEAFSPFGDLVSVVDWLMRSHAMEERLPLPVDAETAEFLQAVPLAAFQPFGHRLFCVGIGYTMPEPEGKLYSDGEIAAAVYNNDSKAIRRLASPECWKTQAKYDGSPPLVLASLLGHTELCRLMLELGADVNIGNARGVNGLQAGIVSRQGTEHAAMFLESGADADATNDDGFTAMHAAAEVDDGDMIRYLAERGANLELQTDSGFFPIHIAAGLGHQTAAEALVDCGVELRIASDGRSPKQIAQDEDKTELANWFAQQA